MIKCIKHFILAFGMLMLAYSDAPAQVVVTNPTQLAGNLATWAEEAVRWNNTIMHYRDQIKSYEKELKTKIGNRDLVGLLDTAANLYSEGQQMEKLFDQLGTIIDGNSSLSNKSAAARDKLQIYNSCDKLKDDEKAKAACSFIFDDKFKQTGEVADVIHKFVVMTQELSNATKKIKDEGNTSDSKSSQDVLNALNAQLIALEAQKGILEAYIQTQAIEREKAKDMQQQYVTKTQTQGKDLGEFGGSGSSSPHSADDDD
jgi:hypothetical protein